jgi:hypothetical protein
MSESDPTGYHESPNTTDPADGANLVDGVTGRNPGDGGDRDTTLTTDDAAQREDSVSRPGNDAG